jgi:predicted ester cyclase
MKKIFYLFILIVTAQACNQKENMNEEHGSNNGNNQTAANEERMREFYQTVINGHNPAMIDSFVTADFVEHQPWPGKSPDREGLKQGFTEMMAAFPDMHATVDMVKCWGDTVMAKFTMKGMNSGMFMGGPATNKEMNVEGVDIIRIKDGKAIEHWGYMEEMKMMNQLGMGQPAGPPPAPGNK